MLESDTKKKVRARLRRVEGQLAALRRMVDEDASCVDLLMQISAAQGALGATGQVILGEHIATCVSDALERGDDADRQRHVDELMEVFARYSRIGAR